MQRTLHFYIYLLMLLFVFTSTSASGANAKLIVQHAFIVTMAANEKKPFMGYLVIAKDGTILKIGHGKPPANLKADKLIDAQGKWLIPGFVSAHSHFWQAAFRGLAADKTLSEWIDDLYLRRAIKAKPGDFYWFTLLGALNHLEHGITTAYNFNYGGADQQTASNVFDEEEFRAEQISGIRFIHGYKPDFMKNGSTIANARNRLKAFNSWITNQPTSSHFLCLMINGMTAFNDTYQQAIMEATLMKEFNIGNQSHYLEPPETTKQELEKFHWFEESGLLSNKLIFGHFIHTNDYVLQQTAKSHAGMSWNPLSNGRLASGVADIPNYLKMGIRIGMGVDGEASADIADPFENMRVGLYSIRSKYENAAIMSPYEILWLHTMGSADVLGIKNKVGSLEPGKFGDFILINPHRLGAVLEDPYANLVFATGEQDIDSIYVGGELQVTKNQVLRHHLKQIQNKVARLVMKESSASPLS